MDTLPLVEVARAWEISIDLVPFNGRFFGAYQPVSRHISLSTFNRRTWAHELVHAADDRRGFLPLGEKKTAETLAEAEIVAELGAAVLLEAAGESEHVDLGAASRYLQHYAGEPSRCVAACRRLLQRTCGAVGLILDTADQLRALGPMPSAAIVEALEVTP